MSTGTIFIEYAPQSDKHKIYLLESGISGKRYLGFIAKDFEVESDSHEWFIYLPDYPLPNTPSLDSAIEQVLNKLLSILDASKSGEEYYGINNRKVHYVTK